MELPPGSAHERRLQFWRQVCGCQAGALCAIAALVWYGFAYDHASASTLWVVVKGAGVVIAAAVIGKAAAIIGARAFLGVEILLFARRADRTRCCSGS